MCFHRSAHPGFGEIYFQTLQAAVENMTLLSHMFYSHIWCLPQPVERLRIDSSGHVLPGANNTYDLGSTAKGWRNVYMNDLNLSNMNGDTNDVDGTQGLDNSRG